MKRLYVLPALAGALLIWDVHLATAQEPAAQPVKPPVTEPEKAVPEASPATPHMKNVTEALPATGEQAKPAMDYSTWVGMPLESIDGQQVGKIADVVVSTGGAAPEIHADIGGFWGFGARRIKIRPAQITQRGDKVVVSLTKAELDQLPEV